MPSVEDMLAPQSNLAQTQSPAGKIVSDNASSKHSSSSSSSAGHSLSAQSLPSARSSHQDEEYKKQLLLAKKLSLIGGNKPVLGAGVGLSSSSSSSKRSDAGAGPELAEKLKLAKLRSELEQRQLKSKIEVAELELQLARSQPSAPSTPRLPPPAVAPVTPPPKATPADPHSPTSDEAILQAMRSQVAELESRVEANRKRAEIPAENQVSTEVAAVRLELEMLKKEVVKRS